MYIVCVCVCGRLSYRVDLKSESVLTDEMDLQIVWRFFVGGGVHEE